MEDKPHLGRLYTPLGFVSLTCDVALRAVSYEVVASANGNCEQRIDYTPTQARAAVYAVYACAYARGLNISKHLREHPRQRTALGHAVRHGEALHPGPRVTVAIQISDAAHTYVELRCNVIDDLEAAISGAGALAQALGERLGPSDSHCTVIEEVDMDEAAPDCRTDDLRLDMEARPPLTVAITVLSQIGITGRLWCDADPSHLNSLLTAVQDMWDTGCQQIIMRSTHNTPALLQPEDRGLYLGWGIFAALTLLRQQFDNATPVEAGGREGMVTALRAHTRGTRAGAVARAIHQARGGGRLVLLRPPGDAPALPVTLRPNEGCRELRQHLPEAARGAWLRTRQGWLPQTWRAGTGRPLTVLAILTVTILTGWTDPRRQCGWSEQTTIHRNRLLHSYYGNTMASQCAPTIIDSQSTETPEQVDMGPPRWTLLELDNYIEEPAEPLSPTRYVKACIAQRGSPTVGTFLRYGGRHLTHVHAKVGEHILGTIQDVLAVKVPMLTPAEWMAHIGNRKLTAEDKWTTDHNGATIAINNRLRGGGTDAIAVGDTLSADILNQAAADDESFPEAAAETLWAWNNGVPWDVAQHFPRLPPSGDTAWRTVLSEVYNHVQSSNLGDEERILMKYAGRERDLFTALVIHHSLPQQAVRDCLDKGGNVTRQPNAAVVCDTAITDVIEEARLAALDAPTTGKQNTGKECHHCDMCGQLLTARHAPRAGALCGRCGHQRKKWSRIWACNTCNWYACPDCRRESTLKPTHNQTCRSKIKAPAEATEGMLRGNTQPHLINVNVLDRIPSGLQRRYARVAQQALEQVLTQHRCGDDASLQHATQWLLELPKLVLRKPAAGTASAVRKEIKKRLRMAERNQWKGLYDDLQTDAANRPERPDHNPDVADSKITSLVMDGQTRKAATLLASAGTHNPTPKVMRAVREKLCPEGGQTPCASSQTLTTTVSMQSLLQVLEELPSQRAAGPSGWRYPHLKAFATDGHAAQTLLQWCRLWTEERIRQPLLGAVKHATIVPLKKPGNPAEDAVRPIVLTEAIVRLPTMVALHQLSPQLQAGVDKRQYGLGKAGGAETMVTALDATINAHPDWVWLHFDLANAFGSVSRAAVWRQVQRHHLGIQQLLRNTWNIPLEATCQGSDETIRVDGGLLQGDPLSPILFSLTIAPQLKRIEKWCNFMATYIDDITIAVDPKHLDMVLHALPVALREANLSVQPAKTQCATWTEASHRVAAAAGLQVQTELHVLGTDVREDIGATVPTPGETMPRESMERGVKADALAQRVCDMMARTAEAQSYSHAAAWALYKQCVSTAAAYDLRTLPQPAGRKIAEQHYRRCKTVLEAALGISERDGDHLAQLQHQHSLQYHNGGASLPPPEILLVSERLPALLHGLRKAAEANATEAALWRQCVVEEIAGHLNTMRTNGLYVWPSGEISKQKPPQPATPLEALRNANRITRKNILKEWDTIVVEEWQHRGTTTDRSRMQAMTLPCTAAWLTTAPQRWWKPPPNEVWRVALRQRYGLLIAEPGGCCKRQTGGGKQCLTPMTGDAIHGQMCKNGPWISATHRHMVVALADAARAAGREVLQEQHVPDNIAHEYVENEKPEARLDIEILPAPGRPGLYVDATVRCPHAAHVAEASSRQALAPMAAGKKQKHERYDGMGKNLLVAVASTYGGLDSDLMDWLRTMAWQAAEHDLSRARPAGSWLQRWCTRLNSMLVHDVAAGVRACV